MKRLCVMVAVLCAAAMVAHGAPSLSSAEATSTSVEAKAQAYVVQVYNALKNKDEESFKKVDAQIDSYVQTLSQEDQNRFFQAFEKAYNELISTGTVAKSVTSSNNNYNSKEMYALMADYAIALAKVKAQEAITSGTERAKEAVAIGADKAKAAAEVGAAMAKDAAAKASVAIDEAAVKAQAMYKEAAVKAEATYKEAAVKAEAAYKEAAAAAEEAYKAAAAAVANLGF